MCVYPACGNSYPRRNHQRHVHSLRKQFHISHDFQCNFVNTFDIGKWSLLNLCIYPLKSPSQYQSNNSNGDNFKRFLSRIAVILRWWKSSSTLPECYADLFFLTCKIKTTGKKKKKVTCLFKGGKRSNVLNYTPDLKDSGLFFGGGGRCRRMCTKFCIFFVLLQIRRSNFSHWLHPWKCHLPGGTEYWLQEIVI